MGKKILEGCMKDKCQVCGKIFADADVVHISGFSICRYCSAVSELAGNDSGEKEQGSEPRKPFQKGIEIIEKENGLMVRYSWSRFWAFIGFPAFVLFLVVMTLAARDLFNRPFDVIQQRLTVREISIFFYQYCCYLAMGYFSLASCINKTVIMVNSSFLKVRHSPLPWFGSLEIKSGDIEQIYCRYQHVPEGKTNSVFVVFARMKQGKSIKLIGGIDSAGQAVYIERTIEKYLGIENLFVINAIN